jgi:preprotein translocase subunit YajC
MLWLHRATQGSRRTLVCPARQRFAAAVGALSEVGGKPCGREVTMPVLLSNSGWMQPEATTAAPGDPEPAGKPPSPGGFASFQPLIFLALMFGIFYFLLIRPQQKRQRETDNLLKALKKGDKVRTSGGIRGEILDLTDNEVTLLIADKVKINVLRSHVASRLGAEPAKDSVKEPAKDSVKEKA